MLPQHWNPQKSAFYTEWVKIGRCNNFISGFDFISNRPFPEIKPATTFSNDDTMSLYGPQYAPGFWASDGQSLLLSASAYAYDENQGKFFRGPSSIEVIDISGDTPVHRTLKTDPQLDYRIVPDGEKLNIMSQPYSKSYCPDE